jgi:hypothetical protein
MNASTGGDADSPETITPTKRRYGPKPSIGRTSPVAPGRNGRASEATTSGGLVFGDTPQKAFSSHVEDVGLTADEEPSSALSGTVRELDSTYSVNNHNPLQIEDSMTESQRNRPKRMKSGGKKAEEGGAPCHVAF